ncbi:hypothetical protein [Candidatus Mycobacterium methanotrophicum]|uniref:hypothetical protein n=1 Tax=Candidatus Mycobacterium methanotrophicum TaxID=2943498 RepID=UPI0027D9BDFA|nr:hypothetical protein [Candidatus Mycobacterium methanotrophicum]
MTESAIAMPGDVSSPQSKAGSTTTERGTCGAESRGSGLVRSSGTWLIAEGFPS